MNRLVVKYFSFALCELKDKDEAFPILISPLINRYGVSPVPEVIDWRHLTANDSYLVVASDGIFESLSPQNVCDLLRDADVQVNEMSKSSDSCSSSSSLADCIVKEAYKKGSGDNLSAILIPLKFTGLS